MNNTHSAFIEYTPKHGLMPEWTKPMLLPLTMIFVPQPDITAYEMAKSIPYLLSHTPTFPDDIDINEPHFRHFKIVNHNKIS